MVWCGGFRTPTNILMKHFLIIVMGRQFLTIVTETLNVLNVRRASGPTYGEKY